MVTEVPSTDGTCGERVGQGTVTFPCSLSKGHPGPHYAIENSASVTRRRRWEQEQQHAKSALAEFQGFPKTTAEALTVNPTDPPQSPGTMIADAQAARANLQALADQAEAEGTPEAPQWRQAADQYDADVAIGAEVVDKGITGPPVEDGLTVLLRTERYVLKELPDGNLMIEDPSGRLGARVVLPTWIDVADDEEHTTKEEFDQQWAEGQQVELSTAQRLLGVEEPTKTREGDQPLPVPNEFADSYEALIADLHERRQVGVSRYGVALQPFNSRNTVLDAYEESLDMAVYLRTLLTMREASRRELVDVAAGVLRPLFEAANFRGQMVDVMAVEYAEKVADALLDAFGR